MTLTQRALHASFIDDNMHKFMSEIFSNTEHTAKQRSVNSVILAQNVSTYLCAYIQFYTTHYETYYQGNFSVFNNSKKFGLRLLGHNSYNVTDPSTYEQQVSMHTLNTDVHESKLNTSSQRYMQSSYENRLLYHQEISHHNDGSSGRNYNTITPIFANSNTLPVSKYIDSLDRITMDHQLVDFLNTWPTEYKKILLKAADGIVNNQFSPINKQRSTDLIRMGGIFTNQRQVIKTACTNIMLTLDDVKEKRCTIETTAILNSVLGKK